MVVRTFWPGASAQEVERQVTDKIEKKLQETPYLDRISSYSRAGESTVMFFAKDSKVVDEPFKDVWALIQSNPNPNAPPI